MRNRQQRREMHSAASLPSDEIRMRAAIAEEAEMRHGAMMMQESLRFKAYIDQVAKDIFVAMLRDGLEDVSLKDKAKMAWEATEIFMEERSAFMPGWEKRAMEKARAQQQAAQKTEAAPQPGGIVLPS